MAVAAVNVEAAAAEFERLRFEEGCFVAVGVGLAYVVVPVDWRWPIMHERWCSAVVLVGRQRAKEIPCSC